MQESLPGDTTTMVCCVYSFLSEFQSFFNKKLLSGQLGDGTTTDKYLPIEITAKFTGLGTATIVGLSLGALHSMAITSDGKVYLWFEFFSPFFENHYHLNCALK